MSTTSSRRTAYSLVGALVALAVLSSAVHRWGSGGHSHLDRLNPTSLVRDPAGSLAYRTHLERTTSPASQITHSPTLTFDHIYVLSLPTRHDRREQMEELARAHGLRVTFVDAVDKNEPFIRWIAERAVEVRSERLEIMVRSPVATLVRKQRLTGRGLAGPRTQGRRLDTRRPAHRQRLARPDTLSRF